MIRALTQDSLHSFINDDLCLLGFCNKPACIILRTLCQKEKTYLFSEYSVSFKFSQNHVSPSTNFPFFSASDDRWKNSIRHNLSLYPEFVKGVKTQENTGHLWHLDMVLIEKRRGCLQGANKVMMEEEENEEEEEEVDQKDEERWSRLSTSVACPQTDLQRCALEILAGVKRPTTV